MKPHPSGFLSTLPRHATLLLTGAAFLTLSSGPLLAAKGGKGGGKPGDGGGDPPANPAPIEYELTWFPGTYGYTEIHDINSSGIAVGRYHDETGTRKAFWTTSDGVINPLDNWWSLPAGYEGWQIQSSEMQINETNQVCGIIANSATSEYELFLADLFDPGSLEPVGSVPFNAQWLHMNELGDVVFMATETGWYPLLYVRSLNKIFSFETEYTRLQPTGINDNLQVSLVDSRNYEATGLAYHGSALLTFDPATESAVLDELGSAQDSNDPVTLPWGGVNNAGTVFGAFETQAPNTKRNRRTGDTTAGFILSGSANWTELDPALPSGSSLWSSELIQAAACILSVNESSQMVGGYESVGRLNYSLWLRDPQDGLYNLNDLVVGSAADVDAFRSAARRLSGVELTESDPTTGYGFISGYDVYADAAFILTPRLVQQP